MAQLVRYFHVVNHAMMDNCLCIPVIYAPLQIYQVNDVFKLILPVENIKQNWHSPQLMQRFFVQTLQGQKRKKVKNK